MATMQQASDWTHKHRTIIQEKSKPELTAHTDFLNRHTIVLQTSSYLVTENRLETRAGVMKPQKIIPKPLNQDCADIENLLSAVPEVRQAKLKAFVILKFNSKG